jgi:hypothetical protein
VGRHGRHGGRATIALSSDSGDDALARIVFPGDYAYFRTTGAPDTARDVQVIQHGAVSIQ